MIEYVPCKVDITKLKFEWHLTNLLSPNGCWCHDFSSTIRDKIIPHAVSWFTGEAVQGDEFEDMEDDDDDDDGDENEDEDEEDEEDDDEEEDKVRKKV